FPTRRSSDLSTAASTGGVWRKKRGGNVEASHRDRIFSDPKRSNYLWCLHCERAYERGKWRTLRGFQMCPYLDCDGDAVIDALDWAAIRDEHPEYPERPK